MESATVSPKSSRESEFQFVLAGRRRELAALFAQIFARRNTFTWEVGAGHGHFLTAYAAAHPEELCIGIDIVGERIERALRKRDRAKLDNLEFIQAEARLFLEVLPPSIQIGRTFVLFPDPWPKVRQRKHRIMQTEFLRNLAAQSRDDARIHFRTDFFPYFDSVCATVARDPLWMEADEAWPFEFTTVFQSRAVAHRSLTLRRRRAADVHA